MSRIDERERAVDQKSVLRDDDTYAKVTVGDLEEIDSAELHKVLGMNWQLTKDTFVLKLDQVVEFGKELEPTKRNVLRIAAKLFQAL